MTKPSQPDVAFKRKMGRPKSPDLERRILQAAGSFISGRGLDGVSMDEIAWKAGISKTTLYVYFRSKQDLFEAVLHDLLAHLPPATGLVPGDSSAPIEEQLLVLAKRVNRLLSSAEFELGRRALASDIPVPLRERIWKTAGLPYLLAIEEYLLVQAGHGRLDLKGSRSAASWFLALVAGGEALRSQWFGASRGLLKDDHLRRAVQVFIRGHAP
jgi:AcrR family transcriptional regulator